MTLPPIPSNVAPFIQQAAKGTGLPEPVVAAQNYTESAYGTNQGPSSAGAEGPWQFLPSTFTGLGFPLSGIWGWDISTQAYIKYMNELLKQEGGNVRNALAAYNAGPGNLAAGYGYADTILSEAGQSQNLQTGGPAPSPSGSNIGTTGILSWPGDIIGFFKDAKTLIDALLWIVNPASWLRIGSFAFGLILLFFAIMLFMKASSDEPLIPSTIPIPVPV